MSNKFLIGWIVIFVVWFAGSFVVHGLLLHDDYGRLPTLFRTEADAQNFFPLMILAHIILAGAPRLDLFARRRARTVVAARVALRGGGRLADGRPDLHYLLRGAADARRACCEADRIRRHSAADPRFHHRLHLSAASRHVKQPLFSRHRLIGHS